MSSVSEYILPEAREALRREIGSSSGNEVFFRGELNAQRQVVRVKPYARGNDEAVPVFARVLKPGDVVIHNHPGGDLTPSDADIDMSSYFGQMSVGSYIVDNSVESIYVIVEPFEIPKEIPLDTSDLRKHFDPEGTLSRLLPTFEFRQSQVDMLERVVESFNEGKLALIEAGTGTGKTFAYLVPAIFWAIKNKERVVISTNTINLQEQLIHKDIPALRSALGMNFEAVLVKGRGNYLCQRKLEALKPDPQLTFEGDQVAIFEDLATWAAGTEDGSLSDLPFVPPQEIWEKVSAESDFCAIQRCGRFQDCFANRARRRAASADLLVVNHHLLFADLHLRRSLGDYTDSAVLPPYRRVILDEAHNLEDAATAYFSDQISDLGIKRLLGRLYRKSGPKKETKHRGLLPVLSSMVHKRKPALTIGEFDGILNHIDLELVPIVEGIGTLSAGFFNDVFDFARNIRRPKDQRIMGGEDRFRITAEIAEHPHWERMGNESARSLVDELRSLAESLDGLRRHLYATETAAPMERNQEPVWRTQLLQLRQIGNKLEATANFLVSFYREAPSDRVQWVETKRGDRGTISRLVSSPLLIGPDLAEHVYPYFPTLVMTSATLTSGGKFDYLKSRIGLESLGETRVTESVLPSPFDFPRQALLAIPLDIPEPQPGPRGGDSEFEESVSTFLLDALQACGGGAFILFTAYGMLDRLHGKIAPKLEESGIQVFRQGEAARDKLLARFRSDVDSVLFATSSFWEGVDVQGDSLRCVALAKLPFKVPNEPVLEARVEALEREGRNAFMEYIVPQAVIKFRQGLGRLIRNKTDRGILLILDKRVLTKRYGKVFLNSMPPARLVRGSAEEILQEIQRFFKTA